mgnify:CR=1 FL=1
MLGQRFEAQRLGIDGSLMTPRSDSPRKKCKIPFNEYSGVHSTHAYGALSPIYAQKKGSQTDNEKYGVIDIPNQYDSRFLIVEPVALYDPVYPSLSGVDNAVEIVERSRYNAGPNSRSELSRERPRHGAVLQTSGVSTIDQ